MRTYTATPNDDGVRLSRFVARVTTGLPQSLLHKAFRNKRIKVNGKKAGAAMRLVAGDTIQLYINDEFFARPDMRQTGSRHTACPTATSHIVWENKDIAILYKPAGLLSHSDTTGNATLLGAFIASLIERGQYNPLAENAFAPALANRLDRGTEGLVVGAKRYAALRDINEIIRLGLLCKTYLCIAVGLPPAGTHTAYLMRDKGAKKVAVSATPRPGAKEIATKIEVVETKKTLCLCRVTLLTGRTHQIRAHMAFLGAPLLGDKKYGNPAANRAFGLQTQALCAHSLQFSDTLPPKSTLAALAGRAFTAESYAKLPHIWHNILPGANTQALASP